jgi:hypothetical protein
MGPSVWWDNDLVVKQFEKAAFERPARMVITLGSDEEGGPVYVSTKRLLGARVGSGFHPALDRQDVVR